MKKETLEEAAKKHATNTGMMLHTSPEKKESFIAGAKWQEERMYSEEEVKRLAFTAMDYKTERIINLSEKLKWFEQFKKK